MKKQLLFALVLVAGITKAQTPISITSAQMPSSGDTVRYSNATLASVGDYTSTGANHTWNFSALQPTSQAIREFKNGMNTPYFILFGFTAYGEKIQDTVPVPAITIPGVPAISITDVYNFYSKTSTKFVTEGLGVKINGIPVPNTFDSGKEDILYKFPLNYTDRDSTRFRFSTLTNTLIPFQYVKNGYRITEADGWGSITTPYGTANCLRIVTTQYSMDTLKGTITLPIVGPTPFAFGFPNYVRSYQWLTNLGGEKIPYLEVTGNLNGTTFTPSQAKFRQAIVTFVGLKENETTALNITAYPNPARNVIHLTIPTTITNVKTTLYAIDGKTLKSEVFETAHLFENTIKMDVSLLKAGVYFLDITADNKTQKLKILIQ